jgi:hypothetical protein
MTERQRADGVVPVRLAHPEPEQLVPTLLEGQDALGVVGQLADQQDTQAVRGAWRVGSLAEAAVVLDLVDAVADRRVHPDRLGDAEARAVGVEAALGLAQHLAELVRVGDPLAGHTTGLDRRAGEPVPEHPAEVVRHELVALGPAVVGAPVRDLHELQLLALDLRIRVAVVRVPDARHRQHRLRRRVQRGDERGEVLPRPDVVGRQVGDVRRRRLVEAGVERRAQSAVAVVGDQPDPRVVREQRGDRGGRAVVDHHGLPVLKRLGEQGGKGRGEPGRGVVDGQDDGDGGHVRPSLCAGPRGGSP